MQILRRYLKKDFSSKLSIDLTGKACHSPCICHCLSYAFDDCNHSHLNICSDCKDFFLFFELLRKNLTLEHHDILENYEKRLIYFLAHHARKTYLNYQFKINLQELDQDSALLVVDFKMRILLQSSRETKAAFFGKRGWTLHSVLVYTKNDDNTTLNVEAFDHWSNDTKQDAWFTASSLHIVLENLEKKPKQVIIISDNGPHYHNSELMMILSHWYDWYGIEVRKWMFLEAGEAKTSIDSHHAQVCYIIYAPFTIFKIHYFLLLFF